ncbi:hypothetical protein SGRIM128S_04454 [Streptomyces griseomycini]
MVLAPSPGREAGRCAGHPRRCGPATIARRAEAGAATAPRPPRSGQSERHAAPPRTTLRSATASTATKVRQAVPAASPTLRCSPSTRRDMTVRATDALERAPTPDNPRRSAAVGRTEAPRPARRAGEVATRSRCAPPWRLAAQPDALSERPSPRTSRARRPSVPAPHPGSLADGGLDGPWSPNRDAPRIAERAARAARATRSPPWTCATARDGPPRGRRPAPTGPVPPGRSLRTWTRTTRAASRPGRRAVPGWPRRRHADGASTGTSAARARRAAPAVRAPARVPPTPGRRSPAPRAPLEHRLIRPRPQPARRAGLPRGHYAR